MALQKECAMTVTTNINTVLRRLKIDNSDSMERPRCNRCRSGLVVVVGEALLPNGGRSIARRHLDASISVGTIIQVRGGTHSQWKEVQVLSSGVMFVFTFQVSSEYPHEAPKVKCKTKEPIYEDPLNHDVVAVLRDGQPEDV